MAYADVEIRIFGRIVVKEENKEVERYPVELTVNSEREFSRGYLDPEKQPSTPTKSGYADEDYGNRLFRWLFSDKVLSNAWAEIRGAYPQRRLQLRIDPDEPELHRVIWEALRDPGDIKRLPLALATTDATPFSRYLALPLLPGKPIDSRPIRILLVAPAQEDFREKYPADQYPDLAEINPAAELESLTLALQEPIAQGAVAPPKLLEQPCSLARIMDELRNGNEGKGYHVLQMVCHGSFSTAAQQAKLWLATDDNLLDSLTDTQFAITLYGLLSESGIQDEDKLRLVFLASCESATRSSADVFRGVAPQLVKAGVPAVLAMQDQVGEQTAREFATVFYRQLLKDGQVDLAANVARAQITAKHLPGTVIPVLFLRLPNGQLFAEADQHLEPPERVIFDGLIEEHTRLFAGREADLTEIERFMDDPLGGYLLIEAGAGLGKTALMANLVMRHPEDLAYHFFSPRVSESLQEPVFVRNLLEQISPWYGVTDAPSGQPEEMQKRFDKFLGETPQGNQTIVLDGLDEVSGWDLSRYLARRVQPGLHFVLTVREEGRDPITDYALPVEQVQSMQLVGLTRDGVQAVLRAAGGDAVHFSEDDTLLDQVCRVTAYDAEKPELGADTLFVRFLAEDAAAGRLKSTALTRMPSKMESYLDRWWKAIKAQFGEEGERKKRQQALVDLAMTLAAALGPIGKRDLEEINPSLISDTEQDFVETVIEAVQRIIVRNPRGDVTLFHPRLRDYLQQKLKTERYRQRLLKYCAKWQQHRSRYALTYYARHLADAVAAVDQSERLPWIESLVKLVTNRQFQDTYLAQAGDLRGLQANLQRALETAAEDVAPETLPLLVDSALSVVRFRRERLRPEYIFELAAQGDIVGARRMIELFEMDTKWQHIVLLEAAWLAGMTESKHGRNQARALRAEVATAIYDQPADDQRHILLRWIDTDLEGKPRPQGNLPPASTPMALRATLDAAGGVSPEADVSPEMLMSIEGINWNFIERGIEFVDEIEEVSEEMFISYYIGPGLVALAVDDPRTGESFLKQYLNIHSAYTYTNYRFGSSWALLRPVLQHPDPAWVRDHVRALLIAALGGGSLEFEEGLPLTVLALRAGGCAEASRNLVEYTARIQQEARELSPYRGQGDTWGRYKRLLATLAQAQTVMGVDVDVPSHDLLNDALQTHYGYAGYQAPACLTLAEAVRICRPAEETNWITWALESAQRAAHNIQEGAFCARTTARVNAMRQQWWPRSDLDVRTEIAALRADPRLARFAALHYVRHAYQGRGNPPQSFPLPNKVRYGDTLAVLASAFQRNLPEFLRLNRDWDPEQMIPSGTPIHVPDPGMVPLLAARLAAEVLIVAGLAQEERVALIRSLVPLAAVNPTALDTVLARLLLAERPTDPAMLTQLKALAPMPANVQTDSPQGELTVVVP